ncbi:MAG: AMP-binding protein [Planctomycetia bacterium]|nr:AMP-binding protein [Planctomycetia bacterium]
MARPLTIQELTACGLDAAEAEPMAARVNRALGNEPVEAWREISQRILRPGHPFPLHRFLFERAFQDWDRRQGPPPAWTPTNEVVRASNVGRMMRERGVGSVQELHNWSVTNRAEFWGNMIQRLGIRFACRGSNVLELSGGVERPKWLVGSKLNIAESCFNAKPEKLAIVYHDESGSTRTVTYSGLAALANRVANGLVRAGFRPGDSLAIYLPMTIESVAIYLGIIRAGCVAVSIADSLAAEEIAVRLRLSNAKGIFTQDAILRGGKQLPLYAKVVEAAAPPAPVIATAGNIKLRSGDLAWEAFLSDDAHFDPYLADPHEHTNILFSSGTTGEPKAIPWTHVSPIKCAVDGYLHQGVQPHDRLAWPSNLGWMMGPWLIYASLVNRATMALYGGAPTGRDFGRFVQDAEVTMLGVIPSLVKTWRTTDCMHSLDWSRITRFSSTGECSNPDDMLFLMSLAGYKPVIEYCGGTELAGGYIASTMAQANVPAAFSTPSFGIDLVMAGESDVETAGDCPNFAQQNGTVPLPDGAKGAAGEIFLVPPSIGMSTELLHHDHHAVYFEGTPAGPNGQRLRRHGDAMERLPGGYWRAQGRVDDTMNLGGIKVSSVGIERVLNSVPGIRETAAIAVSPLAGGPSMLWIFAALKPECKDDHAMLRVRLQEAIRQHLNPLFKIEEVSVIDTLPRTASHKIMRRLLRDDAVRVLEGRPTPAGDPAD